ncbi:MAG TPA: hypothetical protein VJT84_10945 [Gaiellaceae bacterium]|nr:hypothetical protein [Gaiellaceae bacterium]
MRAFGIGALIAGSIAVVAGLLAATVLIGPVLFWLAWNVLDFASAVGLPELGFWGIVLATLFLGLGWIGKMAITAIVFLADPSWFDGAAQVHWPATTFRNFVAIALLAVIVTRPRASRKWERRRSTRRYGYRT